MDLACSNFEESNLEIKREFRENGTLTEFKSFPRNLLMIKNNYG